MNKTEAKELLEALYSRYFESRNGYVEIRLIGHGAESLFLPKGEISEEDWASIARANAGSHVYFGVNPRPLSKAKKQDDIKDVVCLWADLDAKDFDGGKEEALRAAEAFPLPPTAMVDSGHGYHLYWVLSEPAVELEGDARTEFKRILAGIIAEVGGDRSKVHLDACLRLPGTLNIKDAEALECRLIKCDPAKAYTLEDFAPFKDADFEEVQSAEGPLPDFGKKTQVVSMRDAEAARADVEKLAVPSKTKSLILTGARLRTKGTRNSRSERDFSIICSLISNDYDYATIKGIFLNPLLKCSNRIAERGEATLQQDVRSALGKVGQRKARPSPQSEEIERIKGSEALSPDQKRKEIEALVVRDLLTGPDAAGSGFRDPAFDTYYFFDRAGKMLMALEGTDFYCYARDRYGISKRDFEEIKDGIMASIWKAKTKAAPRRFAHYDRDKLVLYVSNHDNGIYRVDGGKVELCDNGTDGVFFEYDPSLTPYTYDPNLETADYFGARTQPGRTVQAHKLEKASRLPGRAGFTMARTGVAVEVPPLERSGFSLERFNRDGCLVKEFLADRASFAEDEDNPLSPSEQRMFLALYFYSTFFESVLKEKPVACFVGLKESGKSFIATSIGKIFFGDSFESSGLPKSADDLAVVLGRNHYLVLDNLDAYMKGDMLNLICSAATGVEIKKRQLYTDGAEVKFVPHCFLAITSREPKFKRDDLVSRLLLFHTRKISTPLSRSELIASLLRKRDETMTETLNNLNSIVKLLKAEEARRSRPGWRPERCISRLADWETLGRAMCGTSSGYYFRLAMQVMNEAKDQFAVEDDYLYLTLHRICCEKGMAIKEKTAAELFQILEAEAEDMGLKDFDRHYKSPMAVAKKLTGIRGELERELVIELTEFPHHVRAYSLRGIGVQSQGYEKEAGMGRSGKKALAGGRKGASAWEKRKKKDEEEGDRGD